MSPSCLPPLDETDAAAAAAAGDAIVGDGDVGVESDDGEGSWVLPAQKWGMGLTEQAIGPEKEGFA